MKPLISIIIPIYNVEHYIQECLDSVIRNISYFKDDQVEVLLINDGSTDNSGVIARSYADKYDNFIFLEQSNAGLSEARNTGVHKANGQYIFFLDSDDQLIDTALYDLHTFAEHNKCDICQGGMLYYFGDSRDYLSDDTYGFFHSKILNQVEALKLLIENRKIKSFACGKLYKKELIKEKLFDSGRFFEDIFWQHRIVGACKIYGALNKPVYKYRQREDSITGSFSPKKIDLLDGYDEMISYIRANYPELYKLIIYKFWTIYVIFNRQLAKSNVTLNSTQRQRLQLIGNKYELIFPKVLKYDIHYRLYSDWRVGYSVLTKFENLYEKVKGCLLLR